jgi:hypothetical protein
VCMLNKDLGEKACINRGAQNHLPLWTGDDKADAEGDETQAPRTRPARAGGGTQTSSKRPKTGDTPNPNAGGASKPLTRGRARR